MGSGFESLLAHKIYFINVECKFCGKECKNKNSLVQHEIRCPENPDRIINSFAEYNKDIKGKKIKPRNQFTKAKELGLPIPIVSESTRELLRQKAIGRKHSEETKKKISESYKKYLQQHPEKVGFVINHSSKQSYPEQYFEKVFLNENIDLKYHKQVGRYELDFYNDDLMKYVEIDGNQHKLEYMRKHDIERDEYLRELGWTGIRVCWSEYKTLSEEEKREVVQKIKNFLEISTD